VRLGGGCRDLQRALLAFRPERVGSGREYHSQQANSARQPDTPGSK
jgi:hypothetical protein